MKCPMHYFTHWAKLSIVRCTFSWLQGKENHDPSEEGTQQSGSTRQHWITESPRLEKTFKNRKLQWSCSMERNSPRMCKAQAKAHMDPAQPFWLLNCNWFICVHTQRRDFCISSQRPGLKPPELGEKSDRNTMLRNTQVIFREIKFLNFCLPVPSILLKP